MSEAKFFLKMLHSALICCKVPSLQIKYFPAYFRHYLIFNQPLERSSEKVFMNVNTIVD